jgi:hypothetical protein
MTAVLSARLAKLGTRSFPFVTVSASNNEIQQWIVCNRREDVERDCHRRCQISRRGEKVMAIHRVTEIIFGLSCADSPISYSNGVMHQSILIEEFG